MMSIVPCWGSSWQVVVGDAQTCQVLNVQILSSCSCRLKHTCPNITWDDIGALLLKMFPLAKWHCTRKLLEMIFDDFMKASIDSSDKRKEFYKQDVDLNHCGVFLHQLGIGYTQLSDTVEMGDVLKSKESDDMLINGVIIDLVKVRNTGKFSSSGLSIILWIETLLDMKYNASKTNLHVKSLFAKYNQLLRDSKHSPEKLADFLNSRFQLPTSCLEPVNTTDETSPGSTITTASSSTP